MQVTSQINCHQCKLYVCYVWVKTSMSASMDICMYVGHVEIVVWDWMEKLTV